MQFVDLRKALLGISAITLAACGSGGGGSGGGTTVPLNFVSPPDLPTTGAAVYTSGVNIVVAESGGPITLSGDLSLEVGFAGASGTVGGDIANLSDSAGATYTGDFDLVNGDIDRNAPSTEFTLFAELDGNIVNAAGVEYESVAGSGRIGGDFFGSDGAATPEQVRGNFSGTLGRSVGGGAATQVVIEEDQSTFTASQ